MSDWLKREEIVRSLREKFPVGTIVVLDEMDDVQAPPIGSFGKVSHVDDIGTIFVSWFSGGGLGVVYGVDRCHIASDIELENYQHQVAAAQNSL